MKMFFAVFAWAAFCLLALAPPIQAHTAAQCKCQCDDNKADAAQRMAERDQERAAMHLPSTRPQVNKPVSPDHDDD